MDVLGQWKIRRQHGTIAAQLHILAHFQSKKEREKKEKGSTEKERKEGLLSFHYMTHLFFFLIHFCLSRFSDGSEDKSCKQQWNRCVWAHMWNRYCVFLMLWFYLCSLQALRSISINLAIFGGLNSNSSRGTFVFLLNLAAPVDNSGSVFTASCHKNLYLLAWAFV